MHCVATRHRLFVAIACLCSAASRVQAKDISISAIVLYDAPNGAAYVQMTDVMLNGKTELRSCTLGAKIDKSGYGRLQKVQIKGADSLERNAAGVLMLTTGAQSSCVVPSNLHLEGKNEFSLSELADQAVLQGNVVSSSANQPSEIPALKPGVRLVFVSAADTDLAEYLRAQRARSIPAWQEFLSRYASSSRAGEAKKSLAVLFEESAEAAFTL